MRDVVDQELYSQLLSLPSHFLISPPTRRGLSVPQALDDFSLIGPEPQTKGLRAQTILVRYTFNQAVCGLLWVTKHCALDLGYSPTKHHMLVGRHHVGWPASCWVASIMWVGQHRFCACISLRRGSQVFRVAWPSTPPSSCTPNRWYRFDESKKRVPQGPTVVGWKPTESSGNLVGLDISRKGDSFGVLTWPALKTLDQQRPVRAEVGSAVIAACWVWRLCLPLLWKLNQGAPARTVSSLSPQHPTCNKSGWQSEFSFQRTLCLVAQANKDQCVSKHVTFRQQARTGPQSFLCSQSILKALKAEPFLISAGTKNSFGGKDSSDH